MAKTVIITGSSSGIGKATAELFAKSGWNVIATSRSADKELFSKFDNVTVLKLDVTDSKSIEDAFTEVQNNFGKIDMVINNAGYGLDGVFEALTDDQIKKQFETNVFGLMAVTRKAIEVMKPNRAGKIIQVSSMGGRITFPLYSIYHSSKWAVEGFSESLQYELRQFNIQIKLIEPGVINTSFYGSSRKTTKPDSSLDYDDFINKVESVSQNAGAGGGSPQQVAKTILKAACSNNSKLRYPTTSPAPLLLFVRKILPDKIFFSLIRSRFKI